MDAVGILMIIIIIILAIIIISIIITTTTIIIIIVVLVVVMRAHYEQVLYPGRELDLTDRDGPLGHCQRVASTWVLGFSDCWKVAKGCT